MKILLGLIAISISVASVANAGGAKSRITKTILNAGKAIDSEEIISDFNYALHKTIRDSKKLDKEVKSIYPKDQAPLHDFKFLTAKLAGDTTVDVKVVSFAENYGQVKTTSSYLTVNINSQNPALISDMIQTLKTDIHSGMVFPTYTGLKITQRIDTYNVVEMAQLQANLLKFAQKASDDSFTTIRAVTTRKSTVVPFRGSK